MYPTVGTWVNDNEAFCFTPSFVKDGPREASVFLNIDNKDLTL